METRASRAVVAAGQASQAAPSRKLGTSNARANAKAEAGRNHKATTRKVQVLRARAVLIGCSRIKLAHSLGFATSMAKQATGQQTVCKKEKYKPLLHTKTKCFGCNQFQEFKRVLAARWLFACREMASPVTSEFTDKGLSHMAPTFARQVECFFSAED